MISNLLREHTQHLHQRIERSVDLERWCRTLLEYRRLLARTLGLVEPLEQLLGSIDWRPTDVDRFEPRRKTPWLIADLRALDLAPVTIAALPRCEALPRVDSLAAAFGCLYVLEGASLGGRIIARAVHRRLGVGPTTGGSFHAGYGAETGTMWRRFCAAANVHVGDDASKIVDALAAAEATFRAYEQWFTTQEPRHDPVPV